MNHSIDEKQEDKTDLLTKTKLLRDTLELLLENSEEQKKVCEQLAHENRYLQDYVENLMSSSNVLDK
ncbi:LAQU0S06e00364g1_1 [Lachancea quebecensis]|uniref:LAQU0S06e00364g1_1 n=1 Tax=Lachancea quebecensis TaxID=1654605 RepID=A0A0P1KTY7_9SACH|nr:LAQU0S06e00364g1_1 [Lachancea quebecensis]